MSYKLIQNSITNISMQKIKRFSRFCNLQMKRGLSRFQNVKLTNNVKHNHYYPLTTDSIDFNYNSRKIDWR